MKKIFYLHWNKKELEKRVVPLDAAGHEVQGHWRQEDYPKFKEDLPDAVVLSLDRLPSHARHFAGWFWEAKKRQQILIIFCGR